MSIYSFDRLASSNNVIKASLKVSSPLKEYQLKREIYPNISIPNRSLALLLGCLDENSEEIQSLKALINEYNNYLDQLEVIPGFLEDFAAHGFCLSREYISQKWSEETSDFVFSKRAYKFTTDLRILNDYLFDSSQPAVYQVSIDGEQINVPIGKWATDYPSRVNGKTAIWNWVDNGHDFGLYLWQLLGERTSQNEDLDEDDDAVHYYFDYYDEFRNEPIEPQLRNIFIKLESLGYIETYTLQPDMDDPRWAFYGKKNGTIDLALIDTSFLENKSLMDQIEFLLWEKLEGITRDD